MRGRLYSSCVQSSTLHGSEIWPLRKDNEVALHRAELRMVRWMCDVKVKDRVVVVVVVVVVIGSHTLPVKHIHRYAAPVNGIVPFDFSHVTTTTHI